MNKIINFIKYHNLFTIILGLVLLLTAGAFANEDIRERIIGEEIITTSGIDNSQLLAADFNNFDMAFQISEVSEDEESYYVVYTYNTMAIEGNIWSQGKKEKTMKVQKKALAGRDLGLYLTEELGEIADQELAYLKKVQIIEKEKGLQNLTASVEYTGLRGLVLDVRNKILFGYQPVVTQPEQAAGPSSSAGQPAASISSSVSIPETFLDKAPENTTASLEAVFTFRSSKENSFFQCKINKLDWENCVSPKTYSGLIPGGYTFQVFATDEKGYYDETPATFSWIISSDGITEDAFTAGDGN